MYMLTVSSVTCGVKALAIVQKWVPYSQRYLFNAIPDTNHNANPTNLALTVRVTLTLLNLLTLLTLILDTVVNKAPSSAKALSVMIINERVYC